MRDYRKLEVWQLGRQFAVLCYRLTSEFPREEMYGIANQIRRAAVSIPSNISEGAGRDSDAEQLRSVRIALGSLNEVETQMIISSDLEFLSKDKWETFERAATELGVKLRNFAQKLESDIRDSNPKRARYVREAFATYRLSAQLDVMEDSPQP